MRRAAFCLVLAGVLLAAAHAGAFTPVERDAPFRLVDVSRSGRVLSLVYQGGGCLRDDGRALVSGTRERVAITVRQTYDAPEEGTNEVCPSFLAFHPLRVRLAEPVGGRLIDGGPYFDEELAAERVPRVTGLRRRDALAVLSDRVTPRGVAVEVAVEGRGKGVVVRQRPRAGRHWGKRSRVVVTVARRPR